MGDRETWRKPTGRTVTPAPVIAAGGMIARFALTAPQFNPSSGQYCSAEASPRCEPVMPESDKQRLFNENQTRLEHDRVTSDILDSRLEKLCADHDLDPEPRRRALRGGNVIRFVQRHLGHLLTIHIIRPEEFK